MAMPCPMPLQKIIPLLLLALHSNPLCAKVDPLQAVNAVAPQHVSDEGIRFSCSAGQFETIESDMEAYLFSLGVMPDLLVKRVERANHVAVYTLNAPREDANTLDLKDRPELQIRDETVMLPAGQGKTRAVLTVSKKEILLALLQHGRLTEFKDAACDIGALKDHVAIRQNTVAWAEELSWVWPDGGPAKWNNKYWRRGTPKPGYPLHEALNDIFFHPKKYSIGCYTATKVVVMQGVLDYFRRIKKDRARLKLLKERLYLDQDPLVAIEPGRMWEFEKDFDPQQRDRPGKLVSIVDGVGPLNFVPGDWVYLLNTDPVTQVKTGYEGSNAIYLGRNRFDDFYNDNRHAYSYHQKLDEVFQWRNGVFSRARDFAKIRPLGPQELERLGKSPAEGGLVQDFRAVFHYFGYEELPAWRFP